MYTNCIGSSIPAEYIHYHHRLQIVQVLVRSTTSKCTSTFTAPVLSVILSTNCQLSCPHTHTRYTTNILNTADQSQPDSRSRDSIPTNKQTQSHICHRSAYKHPHRPYTRRNKNSTWATTHQRQITQTTCKMTWAIMVMIVWE